MSGIDPHGHPWETRDQAWARNSDNQHFKNVERMQRERELGGSRGGTSAGSSLWLVVWLLWVLLRAMPWLLVAIAAWNWVLVATAANGTFRSRLRAVFPDAWVVEPGSAAAATAPPYVGAVLVVVVVSLLVGVLLGRRASIRAWAHGSAGRLRLYAVTFAWSVLLWVGVAVLLALALVGGWVAAGNALDASLVAPVPLEQRVRTTLVFSAVAATWAALGSVRRCSLRASLLADRVNAEVSAPIPASDPLAPAPPVWSPQGTALPPPSAGTPPPPPPPTAGGR